MSTSDTPPPPSFGSDFWDQRYGGAGPDYVFGTTPNTFLAACAEHLAPGEALCLGEGEGRNAVHLARLGHQVTAVDQSSAGLAKARGLATAHGTALHTIATDLAIFDPAPASTDLVVSIFCHLPPELRRTVHARATAALRPGGHVILEAYHPDQVHHRTGGPVGNPALLMRLDEVRAEFPGVTWTIAQEIERDVIEGSGHTGRAAVTQLFGRLEPASAAN